jgi:SNF2 family DNA or RNA helicase
MDRVFRAMQPAVRFTLDDVTELPPVIERPIDVKMGPKQEHVYEELRKHAVVAIQNHQITAVNAGRFSISYSKSRWVYLYAGRERPSGWTTTLRLDAIL